MYVVYSTEVRGKIATSGTTHKPEISVLSDGTREHKGLIAEANNKITLGQLSAVLLHPGQRRKIVELSAGDGVDVDAMAPKEGVGPDPKTSLTFFH